MASVAPTEVRESYQDAGLLESNTGRYRQHRPAQLRVETSIRRPVPVTAQAQLQPSWNMELPRSLNEYVGATHAAQQNPSIPSVSFTPSHDSAPIINEATPNVSLPKTLPSVSATLPHPFLTIPSASTPTTMSPLPSLNPSTLDAFTATASKAYGLALTPTLHSTFPTTPTGTSDRSTTSPLRPFAMTPNPMTSFSQNNSIPFNPSPSSQLHLYLPPPNFATSTTHEMPHPMFQQHGVSSPRFHALAMVDSSSAQSAKSPCPPFPRPWRHGVDLHQQMCGQQTDGRIQWQKQRNLVVLSLFRSNTLFTHVMGLLPVHIFFFDAWLTLFLISFN
ncbi:hypothetical protein BC829DRAFT_248391 [Chytridium lagenaria]|nr:hypothetical protein BC829DRAFT_248391 [Chytridium lagenaria]